MLIYPAIDLIAGRCVRLMHGRFDQVTTYDDDPLARARSFAGEGAQWLHCVDLDGAREGRAVQGETLSLLARSSGLKVQAGGGVRSLDDVSSLLDAGVARVVVGSLSAKAPEVVRQWLKDIGPERLCLALDVRGAEVLSEGWQQGSGRALSELIAFYGDALCHVLITDVSRDGAMTGVNTALVREVLEMAPHLRVQASGGVAGLEDVRAARAAGADGLIVGRALYEGVFSLGEALDAG
ncbi:MAG: 1-(5-phosphoribosyl)-5-[(5-phosphoribosylamino)methylideneamino]imidazole-4-carboxamide isomerase [Brevundimonas sp.]|jgi:phosphoribosylformimino-5-aminoimidazole carboxamide ribotide isomerase|uniref:1-(5-phosphoribosyl)-5-[(5- phosphoribosylamino)methylideneamino]imidazole-4- carboxamide isomerase n=1 Tax=Brevundimonas sp. TaxID=1871086 RepID=UPI00391A25B4